MVATYIWAGVRFSIITKQPRPVGTAIEATQVHDWGPIAYPQAIYNEGSWQWVSDAEIAETAYTAYLSWGKSEQYCGQPGQVVHRPDLPRIHRQLRIRTCHR